MKRKYGIYALLLLLLSGFCSYRIHEAGDRSKLLMNLMLQSIANSHFKPQDLNDAFSAKVYDLYLERVDYDKRFFTQAEIKQLSVYRTSIDDQMKAGTYEFYTLADQLLEAQKGKVKGYYQEILSQPFDLSTKETIETDERKMPFAKDEAELKEYWHKTLKFSVLYDVAMRLNEQEKADFKGEKKTLEQIEKEEREKEMKRYGRFFERQAKLSANERLSYFINAITNVYDPHSNYFPPDEKTAFDAQMSGQFEGIGASLNEKDGAIEVREIIPGSASARQGELQSGDIIIKVAQGSEEPVDVSDMALDDAIKLIRGKKNTEVRLTVKRKDGSIKVIPILRDKVELRETFAKSLVLNDKKGKKNSIGYIKLPKFYADFQDPNGRHCAEDVRKELEKLNAESVSGVIVDLRWNGGGSLSDVVDMAGLFIDKGPIVQVKSRPERVEVLSDRNPQIQYRGPVVILVNEYSASASEILAAALQDYKRAVIVGSTTFGKGTVQRFFTLDDYAPRRNVTSAADALGAIKLTIQKFYRINGSTTQLNGVVPDIQLSDALIYSKFGEKEEDHPMEWDEIRRADYNLYQLDETRMAELKKRSLARTGKDEAFLLADDNARRVAALRNETVVPLDLDGYRALLKKQNEESEKYKNINKKIDVLRMTNPASDFASISGDATLKKINDDWMESISKDPYVLEAMYIARDIAAVGGALPEEKSAKNKKDLTDKD